MVYDRSASRRPAWAKNAVDLPDLPRPLPQRRHEERPEDGRRALRQTGRQAAVERAARGLLPQLRRRRARRGRCSTATPPARPRGAPHGRDYYGGDLKGVDQQLDYLQALGVNTIYLNPIFDVESNHGYDTAGLQDDQPVLRHPEGLRPLVKHAHALRHAHHPRRRVQPHVLGQPFFDRYHHYATVGACESTSSAYRCWFTFHERRTSPCDRRGDYDGLVRLRLDPGARQVEPGGPVDYFLDAQDSVTRTG